VLPLALPADPAGEPALVCIDPGHGSRPELSREPIGPGSHVLKLKDGGGAAGEAVVTIQLAWKTRRLLRERGLRVTMTRSGPDFTHGRRGNADRAALCNRAGAALMLRIHADGSTDPSRHGVATLYPALVDGWTDDVHAASRRAARLVQRALLRATGAADRGLVARDDLTGFNWADVPVVLAETGFMTNPRERRLLTSPAYQWRVARGLAAGAASFVRSRFAIQGT
jgi:N-acetylmuramoyl-L-alanine amidase